VNINLSRKNLSALFSVSFKCIVRVAKMVQQWRDCLAPVWSWFQLDSALCVLIFLLVISAEINLKLISHLLPVNNNRYNTFYDRNPSQWTIIWRQRIHLSKRTINKTKKLYQQLNYFIKHADWMDSAVTNFLLTLISILDQTQRSWDWRRRSVWKLSQVVPSEIYDDQRWEHAHWYWGLKG